MAQFFLSFELPISVNSLKIAFKISLCSLNFYFINKMPRISTFNRPCPKCPFFVHFLPDGHSLPPPPLWSPMATNAFPPSNSSPIPSKNKFIYPKMSSKSYNVQGDCRQLEFSVELSFLGHSSSVSALNFDDFLRKRQKDGARWYEEQNDPSAPENEEKGILLERRTIRWQQSIPRPTFIEGELGAMGMDGEEENGEGGVEEEENEEETEGEEEEEGKEEMVPEDPAQQQIVPKSGNRGQKRRISHRIFTLLEPIGVGMDGQGEGINGQRPPAAGGQHLPRKQQNGQIEQSKLKEPIRMQQFAQRQKRFVPISAENMRIMAYLGEDSANEYDQSEEWLLWEISLQNGRLLRVEPDFGQRTIPSRRGTFLARLAFNEAIQFDELGEERDLKETDEGELSAAAFEVPEGNGEYWLHYLVEIAKARNFPENGNLRVEWQLEMPKNVQLIQPAMASGQTQQCGTKPNGRDDIAHIGHLFQFTLAYNATTIQSESEGARAADWPMCLFRVISEDSWARFFVDGYACLPLPSNPGQQNISLECWRPIDGEKSKICALKNAHLGQSLDLRHFGLAGPRNTNGNWSPNYSREGLATEGTGQLELVIRCLHQSKHFISRDVLSSLKYTKMVQRSGLNGGLHWRIAKVLEEFERARRQLMALRAKKARKQMGILQIQKEIE